MTRDAVRLTRIFALVVGLFFGYNSEVPCALSFDYRVLRYAYLSESFHGSSLALLLRECLHPL